MAILDAQNLTIKFGGLTAVSDFTLHMEQGDLVGLIGPNGAGKTTIFNMLTGIYKPTEGEIFFGGQSLKNKKPFQVTQMGIARTFQNLRLFNELTVIDNIKVAHHLKVKYNVMGSIVQTPAYYVEETDIQQKAEKMLEIFGLEYRKNELAKNLPYGEQRRLEIARAMATEPQLLLLDEPAAGMNPQESKHLMELIRWIKKEFSLTILLIEHHMDVVMGVCERILVLDYGQTIAEGAPAEIKGNKRVIEAYLGDLGEESTDA